MKKKKKKLAQMIKGKRKKLKKKKMKKSKLEVEEAVAGPSRPEKVLQKEAKSRSYKQRKRVRGQMEREKKRCVIESDVNSRNNEIMNNDDNPLIIWLCLSNGTITMSFMIEKRCVSPMLTNMFHKRTLYCKCHIVNFSMISFISFRNKKIKNTRERSRSKRNLTENS